MSLEQLLILAIFVLVPLLNWVLRIVRRPVTAAPRPEPAPDAVNGTPAVRTVRPRVVRPPDDLGSGGAQSDVSAPPPARVAATGYVSRLRLRERHALRDAMVATMILTPRRTNAIRRRPSRRLGRSGLRSDG